MIFFEDIFNTFIKRFNFEVVYKEQNFPLFLHNNTNQLNQLSPSKSIHFLLSAALEGNPSIGFYNRTPAFSIYHNVINTSVIIISMSTNWIYTPTIFVEDIDNLIKVLPFSFEQSKKHRLPVNIIVSKIFSVNFKPLVLDIRNTEYINPGFVKADINTKENVTKQLEGIYVDFYNVLSSNISSTNKTNMIDVNKEDKHPISFLVPEISVDKENTGNIKFDSSAFNDVEAVSYQFKHSLKWRSASNEEISKQTIKLCPGCPFLTFIDKIQTKDGVIFTDIYCPTIFDIFNIKYTTFINFLAYVYKKDNNKYFFIGNISYLETFFQASYAKINKNNIIFLNNIGNLPSELALLKKIYKVFPYSCTNIKKLKPCKVIEKKCKCMLDKKNPICIEQTYCPALYEEKQKVFINEHICVGCKMCLKICPYRAIK